MIKLGRLDPLFLLEHTKSMKLSSKARKQLQKEKKWKLKEGRTAPSDGFAVETKKEKLARDGRFQKR